MTRTTLVVGPPIKVGGDHRFPPHIDSDTRIRHTIQCHVRGLPSSVGPLEVGHAATRRGEFHQIKTFPQPTVDRAELRHLDRCLRRIGHRAASWGVGSGVVQSHWAIISRGAREGQLVRKRGIGFPERTMEHPISLLTNAESRGGTK